MTNSAEQVALLTVSADLYRAAVLSKSSLISTDVCGLDCVVVSVEPTPQHQQKELAGSVTVRLPRRVVRVETEEGWGYGGVWRYWFFKLIQPSIDMVRG